MPWQYSVYPGKNSNRASRQGWLEISEGRVVMAGVVVCTRLGDGMAWAMGTHAKLIRARAERPGATANFRFIVVIH
jgi:hypothetical protein